MSVSPRAQIFEYLDGPKVTEEERLDNLRVADLTTDQLAHVLSSRRALEASEPPPPLDWETRELTVQERAYRFAQWARSIAIGDDLIGGNLARSLMGLGYSEEETAEVLKDIGIDWHPKTAEELLVSIAAGMLRDGWSKEAVRHALDGLVNDGR